MADIKEGDVFKYGPSDEKRVIVLEKGRNGYYTCQEWGDTSSSGQVSLKDKDLYKMRFICNVREL